MNNQQIAKTIIEQLGGNKFAVMTGAKFFVATNNGLSFKVGRNPKNVNKVRITLEPTDTYKMEFIKTSVAEFKILETFEGIYCDGLREAFTSGTKLYTFL